MNITNDELRDIVEQVRYLSSEGEVANYIPALEKADPSTLSIVIASKHNTVSAGDIDELFTVQSISKILTLAIVLDDLGSENVFKKVGMESTEDKFDSISNLEKNLKPINPMVNAGALVVTDMIKGRDKNEKLDRILTLIHKITNNSNINYNLDVAKSEYETGFQNEAICYLLKKQNLIDSNINDLLEVYTKQCAIEMNCKDLARIGYVLANDGVVPETGEVLISKKVVEIITAVMVICGMYTVAGEFAIKVGIPAKSGVSGALLGIASGKYGIGIYGPSLDKEGNSIAGTKLLELISNKLELSIFK